MFKANKKYFLLFLIFAFAFIYRMLLMLWDKYPSGADIGLHNSVIYSITQSGNTNFLWNFYQIGGGQSLTFPGYHIFVSFIIMMTGMPDYLIHAVIVSLFSSLIVLCAYLLTRAIWKEPAGLIVAFLIAISRFDIEMLLWGGYPNVIALLFIPLTFYLYLQRARFSLTPFLVATSILSGALFLTHSLSAGVYVSIVFLMALFIVVFPKKLGAQRKQALDWLTPLFVGAALVAPFLVSAIPAYLSANSSFENVIDIQLALLSTRVLPLGLVLPLFACIPVFFLLSKKVSGKFFTLPTLLIEVWLLVPLIFTQGYLVGFYIDYNRFLYFVILPVMIFIGVLIDHGSGFFTTVIDTYRLLTSQIQEAKKTTHRLVARFSSYLTRKNIYSLFVTFFVLFAFFYIPIFMTPAQGVTVQSFYQVMNDPGYAAIQWVQQNTPANSVLVSDALYGWWLSGFAQRPTLSAVDPQYLTLEREFEPAKFARNLLDTDYVIDNGYVQVREDGGYIGRHNPMLLAKLNWTYFPYPFLHFNNSETTILSSHSGGIVQSFDLVQLPVKEMIVVNRNDSATIIVKKGNASFNYTQLTTVYQGLKFVNMSITIDSVEGSSADWIRFLVNIKGIPYLRNNTVGLFEEGVKTLGQLIFAERQPSVYVVTSENPSGLELLYNLQGERRAEIQLWTGVVNLDNNATIYENQERKDQFIDSVLSYNVKNFQEEYRNLSLEVFDYQEGIVANNVSYIVSRVSEINRKFIDDSLFSLVFINQDVENNYVAIFKVNRDT